MRRRAVVLLLCVASAAAIAEDADPLYEGRDLLDTPQRDRGIALLEKVIADGDASPNDATKQQRAGRAHMILDQNAEAVAAMERALALEPENVRYAFWVGAAWLAVDVDKSLAAFERAIKLDPEDDDAWFGLGRARDKKEDLAGALAAFRKAVELNPSYTDAHYHAAGVLDRLLRDDEALTAYRKVLELDPTNAGAGGRIGWLEYEAGRFEKALEAWLSVEPHAPDDLELHSEIVQALFALGRYADAAPWREKVHRIHAAAKDEKTRGYTGFCFDRFVVDGLRVRAFEEYDRSEEALYRYIFEVKRDGKVVRRINLEPGPVAPRLGILGGSFFLGANDDQGHVTFDKRWKAEPPYPELKAAVVDAIRGKLEVVTSSPRSKKREVTGK
jgi:tetratricopeptide (TPR) repeat protein